MLNVSIVILLLSGIANVLSYYEVASNDEVEYLKKYDYLDKDYGQNNALMDNKKITNAICKFQEYFRIRKTCHMNQETRDLMQKPRCGLPDITINKSNSSRYVLQGSKWDKKHITWKVTEYTDQVTISELHDVIQYSLDIWASVSGLSFEISNSEDADMLIGFYKRAHLNDGDEFDGAGGILAHAFYPYQGSTFGGDTHMDDEEEWGVTREPEDFLKKSLAVVFVHEFGHALGLAHEPDVSDSIMRPIYSGWSETVTLSEDDINAIQALYGKNEESTTTSTTLPPSTTTTLPPSTTTTTSTPSTTTTSPPSTTTTSPPSTTTTSPSSTTTNSPSTTTSTTSIPSTTSKSTTTSESTTTTTTVEPPSSTTDLKTTTSNLPNEKVDFCNITGIDAIVEFKRNTYLAFKGNSVMLLSLYYRAKVMFIKDIFKGTLLEGVAIDAVLNYPPRRTWKLVNNKWEMVEEKLYIFQRTKVHIFSLKNKAFVEISVNNISSVFSGLPSNLDSAFVWSGDRQIYFTKGSKYYRVRSVRGKFIKDRRYPKNLKSWRGVPNKLDAALFMKRYGVTVFFRGNQYFLFNDVSCQVNNRYPRNLARDWFGCNQHAKLVMEGEEGLQSSINLITDNAEETVPDEDDIPDSVVHTTLREPTLDIRNLADTSASSGLYSSYILLSVIIFNSVFKL